MYRYELHMHSKEGSACSGYSIHDMIKCYKEQGYAGGAITNHFYCGNTAIDRSLPWRDFVMQYARAYFEGQKTAKELDFDLLFGIEECYGDGKEILIYGIEPEIIAENPQLQKAELFVWCDFVRSNGGFIAYAHPFRNRAYIKDPNVIPDMSLVDGFEAYNFCNEEADNEKAVKILASSKKIMLAGSDHHGTDHAGGNGVVLKRRVGTTKELADELKNNDFELYLGKK